jgi:putative ABC transport system substrate-binding protein
MKRETGHMHAGSRRRIRADAQHRSMRRKLLLALGASAFAAPFVSFAQRQTSKVARIGLLGLASASYKTWVKVLLAELRNLGYVEGKNLVIESRWAEGKSDRLPELAAELVHLKVDIIVTIQTPAAQAAMQATNTIPIVMAPAGDPVGTGLVVSLARPGGNVTGFSAATAELAAKTLDLIREILPSVKRVAVLANATDSFTKSFLGQIEPAGRALGIDIRTFMIRGEKEVDAAFAAMDKARVGAVIVQGSLPLRRAADLALKLRIPSASSTTGGFAEAGGLMSYAPSLANVYRGAAVYVDKILKGAKPADLPVQQPTKFDLVINLKTAKAIGIKIPQSILARADKVIE